MTDKQLSSPRLIAPLWTVQDVAEFLQVPVQTLYVRRVWRELRDELGLTGLVSHMLRKTVASFLDDAQVSTRKISDQLGHAKVSMTQERYLGRRLTDPQTADVLEAMFDDPNESKRSQ